MSNMVRSALRDGAWGYLLKESAGEDVIKAVRAVAAGRQFFSRQNPEHLRKSYTQAEQEPRFSLADLTEREQQVLQLLVEGYTNTDIAARLALSPKTVHTYRVRIMDKLQVQTTVGLVRFAIRYGLIAL